MLCLVHFGIVSQTSDRERCQQCVYRKNNDRNDEERKQQQMMRALISCRSDDRRCEHTERWKPQQEVDVVGGALVGRINEADLITVRRRINDANNHRMHRAGA